MLPFSDPSLPSGGQSSAAHMRRGQTILDALGYRLDLSRPDQLAPVTRRQRSLTDAIRSGQAADSGRRPVVGACQIRVGSATPTRVTGSRRQHPYPALFRAASTIGARPVGGVLDHADFACIMLTSQSETGR